MATIITPVTTTPTTLKTTARHTGKPWPSSRRFVEGNFSDLEKLFDTADTLSRHLPRGIHIDIGDVCVMRLEPTINAR